MKDFQNLGLCAPLVRAVVDLGYEAPTPIQTAAIPAILADRDVRGLAQTGSGKTAAFVLPILEKLTRIRGGNRADRAPRLRPTRGLIVVPTRELAAQIAGVIADLGRHLPLAPKTCLAVGGVSINPQMLALRGGADVVVATPGRLLDLIDHGAVHISSVEMLVLDEADRLLSLGFAEELTRVLALLPADRQNLLFSATFPGTVRELADRLLEKPVQIDIDDGGLGDPGAPIVQRAIEVDAPQRTLLLRHLLETHGWSRVLVFVATRYAAGHVVEKLHRARIPAAALHGDLSQGARTQALADFKDRHVQVLVATDLATRGIDIAELPAVVNYDLPRSVVDYLHRIGRTGRAGETGVAISFITSDTDAHFRLIEKRYHLSIERERIPGFERSVLEPTSTALDPQGGVKGKRKSKKDKLREAASK